MNPTDFEAAETAALQRRVFGPRPIAEWYTREPCGLLRLKTRPNLVRLQFEAFAQALEAITPDGVIERWPTEEEFKAAVERAFAALDDVPPGGLVSRVADLLGR